jgi:hypothetical protein
MKELLLLFYSKPIRFVSPDGVKQRGISETAMASLYVTTLEPIDKLIKMNGSRFFSFIQKCYCSQFILLTNVNNNVTDIYFAQSGVWDYSFDRRLQSHQSHFVKVYVQTQGLIDVRISAPTAGIFLGQTSHCFSGRQRCPVHLIINGNDKVVTYI